MRMSLGTYSKSEYKYEKLKNQDIYKNQINMNYANTICIL